MEKKKQRPLTSPPEAFDREIESLERIQIYYIRKLFRGVLLSPISQGDERDKIFSLGVFRTLQYGSSTSSAGPFGFLHSHLLFC